MPRPCRGSFRLRARWTKEPLAHGLYQIVIHEIPYQVPKGRLVEKIANLLEEKKLPLLADIRDESAEEVRLVLEPKTRNVDADVLMEQLFRLTELEVRVPLNLNVIDPAGVPRVMNLREALQAFLDHRREVLQRCSRHRLAAVARRMEVLRGFVIVYVNLDEVIRIIREEDDPKAEMMARWGLSDAQVEAILNMRLRALRRLEEIACGRSWRAGARSSERSRHCSAATSGSGARSRKWRRPRRIRRRDELGRRRTYSAPRRPSRSGRALVEREPVTVLAVAEGLDPRRQGTASTRPRKRGRRRAAFRGPGRDHRPSCRVRQQRAFYTSAPTNCPAARPGRALQVMIDLQ